ncbi:MAG: DoxX family protein [Bacteroidia bacterium]|nr:DoxX family protein [Bacteroidia bacterium]
MKTTKILYWIFAGLIAAFFLMSAFMYLSWSPTLVEGFAKAGLPSFMIPLLGVAKLLGAVAIVNPWFNGIKEWAYAGFTFVLIGAIWVHAATHTPFAMPLIFLILLAISYFYYRRLLSVQKTQLKTAGI